MKKIKIVFDDKSTVTYTLRNDDDWMPYWFRHRYMKDHMVSAILQQYPKSKYDPIDLIKGY